MATTTTNKELDLAEKLGNEYNLAAAQILREVRSAFYAGKMDELRAALGSVGFKHLEIYMDIHKKTTAAVEDWLHV